MNWQWRFAWRWLRSGNPLHLSFVLACLGGIALVVAGFILTHAVLSGFDLAYTRALVGFNGSGVIFKEGGIGRDDPVFDELARLNAATAPAFNAVPFFYGETLLFDGKSMRGVQVKALQDDHWLDALGHYQIGSRGDVSQTKGVYLGKSLDRQLDSPGRIRLFLNTTSRKQSIQFPVAGYFDTGLSEFDETFILMPEALFRQWTNEADRFYGIELFGPQRNVMTDSVLEALHQEFSYPYTFMDWRELNQVFFSALKIEKTVFLVIAVAVMGIAVLNLMILTAIQMVQRTREWRVLEVLGLSPQACRRLFFKQVMLVVITGVIMGWLIGGGIVWVISHWVVIPVPAELYFLDRLPIVPSITPIVSSGVVMLASSMAAIALALRLGKLLQGNYRLH